MKNNTKKAPVKVWKICCIFSILCLFLSLPQISDYHHLKMFQILEFYSYLFLSSTFNDRKKSKTLILTSVLIMFIPKLFLSEL